MSEPTEREWLEGLRPDDEREFYQPVDALAWAVSMFNGPHRHHRHCLHNLSVDEQWEMQRLVIADRKATDEQMNQMGFYRESIVSITSDEWELDVPDLDYSRFTDPPTEEVTGE